MRHLRDELSTIGRRVLTPVAVLFVTYLVGIAGYKLIGGGDASWRRGTWAPVPVTWHCAHRAVDLGHECAAARERAR